MPSGKLLTRLTKIIDELSFDQTTLRFEPHVTLLGGLVGSQPSLSSKTRQLASCVEPYEIQLGEIDYLDEFFRSLFIRVAPTRPVLEANRKARLIFKPPGAGVSTAPEPDVWRIPFQCEGADHRSSRI
jgi:hypothetical protein